MFITVDICSNGLNRLRNSDLVVKILKMSTQNFVPLETNPFRFRSDKCVVKTAKKCKLEFFVKPTTARNLGESYSIP